MRQPDSKVVLLTGDDVVARKLEHAVADDGIALLRTKSAPDTWLALQREAPDVVVVDLTSRAIDGHQLVALSGAARHSETPLLLLSKQNRRELASFAAVLRARDILCKAEPLNTLAARIRMWVATHRAGVSDDTPIFATNHV